MYVGLGLFGNGVDVIYKDKRGKSDVATLTTGAECGSTYAAQFVLMELGLLQPSDVDGARGPRTNAALTLYAVSKAIVYMPGTAPNGAICEALQDDYRRLHPEVNCPKGQWGVPPACIPGSPPQQGQPCPAPFTGTFPNCTIALQPPGSQPPGQTPPWTLPPIPGLTTPPTTDYPPPVEPLPDGDMLDRALAWWDGAGAVTKIAVVGGAAAGAYGLFRLAQKKKLFAKAV